MGIFSVARHLLEGLGLASFPRPLGGLWAALRHPLVSWPLRASLLTHTHLLRAAPLLHTVPHLPASEELTELTFKRGLKQSVINPLKVHYFNAPLPVVFNLSSGLRVRRSRKRRKKVMFLARPCPTSPEGSHTELTRAHRVPITNAGFMLANSSCLSLVSWAQKRSQLTLTT